MPKYEIAMIVTIDADNYDAALKDADNIAAGIGASDEINISAVLDYETDNDGRRVLYLHPENDTIVEIVETDGETDVTVAICQKSQVDDMMLRLPGGIYFTKNGE